MKLEEIKKLMADFHEKHEAAHKIGNIDIVCPSCGEDGVVGDLIQCLCGTIICTGCMKWGGDCEDLCAACYESLCEGSQREESADVVCPACDAERQTRKAKREAEEAAQK